MQASTSNVRYAGSGTLTNIWTLCANDTERTSVLRFLAQRNGFTASAAAIANTLAYNTRVLADGGVLMSPLSALKFYQKVADNSWTLANMVAVASGCGVKVAASRITKFYDLGSGNNDYALWVGSGATQTVVKGFPMATFDGASMYSTTNAVTWTFPFAWAGTAAAVSAQVVILSESMATLTTDASTQTASVLTSRNSQMRSGADPGGNTQIATSGTTDYLGLGLFVSSGGGSANTLYQDNALVATTAVGARAYGTRHLFLGGILTTGTPAARSFTTGNWAEAIHMNAVTTQNAQDLSAYLQSKYTAAR